MIIDFNFLGIIELKIEGIIIKNVVNGGGMIKMVVILVSLGVKKYMDELKKKVNG